MISYYTEDVKFTLKDKRKNTVWLKSLIQKEGALAGNISLIFCSDSYILDINRKFLQHNYYTDIITFDYCEDNIISGDLYISIDTVMANAKEYEQDFQTELDRVMAHGVLHLLGYDDHTDEDIAMMRLKENEYIALKNEI